MAGMYGADVQQLRALAAHLDSSADQLDRSRLQLGEGIRTSAWTGPFASSFRGRWESEYGRGMASAAHHLRDGAQRLRGNAEEQERTSAVNHGGRAPGDVAGRRHVAPSANGAGQPDEGSVTIYDTDGTPIGVRREWAERYGGSWETEAEARAGLDMDSHVSAGADEDGVEASLHAEAWAGVKAEELVRYENGPLSGEAGHRGFSGARSEFSAVGGIGLEGAEASLKAGGFAGSEVSGRASVEVGGVKAGIDAGVTAGVGATAGASAKIGYDDVKIELEVGLSLGVGVRFKPSLSFSPKEAVSDVLSFLGWGG